jgi:hypothetical protein
MRQIYGQKLRLAAQKEPLQRLHYHAFDRATADGAQHAAVFS